MSMTSTTTTGTTTSGTTGSGAHGTQVAKEHVGAAAASAKQEAANVVHAATEHAKSIMGSAGDELRQQGSTQAERLAEFLDSAAGDLGRMADQADASSPSGRLVRSMADASGQMSQRLGERGPDGLVEDLSQFARRRPGLFLMASAAAGFAIGRLARSTDTQAVKQAVQQSSNASEQVSEHRGGEGAAFAGNGTTDLSATPPPIPSGVQGGLGDTVPNATTGMAGTTHPMDSSALPPVDAGPSSAVDPSSAEAASPADGGGR
jgi:hypothetical protein